MGSRTRQELAALIEQATVDCYNESEQATGLYTAIEDNLAIPFTTQMLGVTVEVEAADLTADDQIVAVCSRGGQRQRVPILDLPLPYPAPEGAEWIDAYRAWTAGTW
jgi:hypothetical protein